MPTLVSVSARAERALWTANEFLDWLEPGVHADLINGVRFMHSPVSLRHADLLNFVDHLLRNYIEKKRLGKLYREVVAVRLAERNVFLPDLSFFSNAQLPLLKPSHAPVAPTFVVEALSPRTGKRDTGPKFTAYEAHGVNEYWILDPQTLAHRFYRREGEIFVEFAHGESRIDAVTIPGFFVDRAWLDPDQLPEVAPCLEHILA